MSMKLSVQPRPVVVDENGNEVDLTKEVLIERATGRLILTPKDIVPEGSHYQGASVEVEPLSAYICKSFHQVMECGNPKLVQNLYWDLGLCLRSITSEDNAAILVDALMKGEHRQ